jgi:hypothetical protein
MFYFQPLSIDWLNEKLDFTDVIALRSLCNRFAISLQATKALRSLLNHRAIASQ